MKKIRVLTAVVLAVMLLFSFGWTVNAETLGPDEAKNSVFRVATKDAGGTVVAFGSAFGVGECAPISYLLTNYHVISDNPQGVYIWIGKDTEIRCDVAISVPEKDIAVLRLTTPIDEEPLPLGAEDMAKMGDEVFALGYPTNDISNTITSFADDVSATKGIISKMSVWNDVLYYQIDAALNQGNSGGPLLHENGYVVGIATMKMNDTEGINGAIRIEEALDALATVGVSVKMATLTTATESPVPTLTPTPSPSVSPEISATPEILTEPVEKSSGASVLWLVIFLVAAAAFVGVLVYMLIKRRSDGGNVLEAFLPQKQCRNGYILGISGTYAGAVIALDGETVFFGRDPQRCQLVFDAQDKAISRVHCSVRYDEARDCFTLENYSKNGTYLEMGERLQDGDAADLRSGARFYLVEKNCLFEVRDEAPERNEGEGAD